ncbi:MAG: DUF2178 domain-containing protein [Candidatus Hydrothermarchaeota archaeon]
MDRKKFRLCAIIISGTMGGLIGWSVAIGNPVLPIVAVFGGMALLYLCKSRVEEVIEDERLWRIGEKASQRTLQIFGLMIALTGAVLIALSKGGSAEFTQAGFALAYSACALMVLYYIFYGYYSKKYGY